MKKVYILIAAFILISFRSDELLRKTNVLNSEIDAGVEKANSKEEIKQLGILHYRNKNYVKSEWYLDQLVHDEDCDADVLFKYARLQQLNGRTERAKEYYNKWAVKKGNASLAKPFTDYCDLIIKGEGVDNTVEIFPMPFNTMDYAEYSPVVTNGKLIYTSTKPGNAESPKDQYGNHFTDLYSSDNLDYQGSSQTSMYANSLSTIHNESAAAFSKDGNTIYFTGNTIKGGKKGYNTLGIFRSEYNGYKWSKPELLSFISPGYNYAFPAVSSDGMTLYFSSDIPNGAGGMDIYKSENNSGKWGTPINLGDNVNSAENDVFPSLMENGNETTLFFSSDGRPGYGGLDIYSTLFVSGSAQSNAQILPSPINSSYDDFGYYATGSNTYGYISSNRDGSDDIFYFKRSDEIYKMVVETRVVVTEQKEEKKTVPKAKEKKEEPVITKEETVITKEESVITKEETKPTPEVKPKEKITEKDEIAEKEPEPVKEAEKKIVPETKPEKKKEVKKTETPRVPEEKRSESVTYFSDLDGYYMVIYSAFNLYNINNHRNTNFPDAMVIKGETDFYHIAIPVEGNSKEEAQINFKKERGKYPGAWFMDAKK